MQTLETPSTRGKNLGDASSAIGGLSMTIHRGNLPGEMYFYKVTDKGKILATGKIVIQ